jgi:TatD DNase family protein
LDAAQADEIINLIREHRPRLAAIGEVGLDHWKVQDDEGRKLQREIFSRFIDLSLELDLPLNVHSRSAGRAAIELLLAKGARRVLLHAFDGKASAALPAVEAGFFFSIPPSVVRSEQKRKLVKVLPLSAILLETDSPVLGAVAGERNEPANLIIALKAVAEIKGMGEEEVRKVVLLNQVAFFKV